MVNLRSHHPSSIPRPTRLMDNSRMAIMRPVLRHLTHLSLCTSGRIATATYHSLSLNRITLNMLRQFIRQCKATLPLRYSRRILCRTVCHLRMLHLTRPLCNHQLAIKLRFTTASDLVARNRPTRLRTRNYLPTIRVILTVHGYQKDRLSLRCNSRVRECQRHRFLRRCRNRHRCILNTHSI